jgi:GH24 family phage-related lysozyme (muramidase)
MDQQQPRSSGVAQQVIVRHGAKLVLASASLVAFLCTWEPAKDPGRVYADRFAGGLPTVCNGITKHVSPYPVVVGDYWSPKKCKEVESKVIAKGQLALADCIDVKVSQNTFDALSAMGHNVGVPSVCASRALGLINAGRLADGCYAIARGPDGKPVWSSVRTGKTLPNGKPETKFVQGLYNRRLEEAKLCSTR